MAKTGKQIPQRCPRFPAGAPAPGPAEGAARPAAARRAFRSRGG